jgi:cysteinyl-tRNA synthetase
VKLFNTETRRLEEVPLKKIKMYTCGPTIYDFAHIGNFRTYVFEDVLRRTLRFLGRPVEQAMNLTDVDDKTIRGAIAKNVALTVFTDPFKKAFFEDMQTLGIEPVEHYPAATDYIQHMIAMIQTLLDKKIAYKAPSGSVYFAISRFPRYGRLSHFDLSDLKVNASGDNEADEYEKGSLSDFVLWKAYDPTRDGQIYWESPFGKGRPGWHIECSAMATHILGDTIDIHCGGVDNMFPHHENEIAQSEGCSGKPFVRHWVHVEHLLVDHRKMSKSLGNFYTLRDLLQKGYSGAEVRYLLLATHYRTQLNFTFAGLDGARASLARIRDCFARLSTVPKGHLGQSMQETLAMREDEFKAALADDVNTSVALAALFELIRELNAAIDHGTLLYEDAEQAILLFRRIDQVLGVIEADAMIIPSDVAALLERREKARLQRDFSLSDQMRQAILEKGYVIEDTPQGARLKKR